MRYNAIHHRAIDASQAWGKKFILSLLNKILTQFSFSLSLFLSHWKPYARTLLIFPIYVHSHTEIRSIIPNASVCFARDTNRWNERKNKKKKNGQVFWRDTRDYHNNTVLDVWYFFYESHNRLSVLVNLSDFSRTAIYIYICDARISVLRIFVDVL